MDHGLACGEPSSPVALRLSNNHTPTNFIALHPFHPLIPSPCLQAPNVKLFNATAAEDLIIREDPSVLGGKAVGGVVTNWTLVTLHHDTQSCMDPNVIEAKVVVSSCGHDGPMGAHSVKRLAKLGMVPEVAGMAALDMNAVSGGGRGLLGGL